MHKIKYKGEWMKGLDGNDLEFQDYSSANWYREMHARVHNPGYEGLYSITGGH